MDYNKALNALSDDNIAKNYNFTNDQFMCMFIADTYYLNWNTSIKRFLDIMYQQNKKIWNTERLNKAASINKTPTEVYILASIVHLESPRDKELPTIAGLYINRLKKNMRLASDPTVIFAHNDFTIKRVRFKHLNIKSPYNTYKHRGLPPGPISTAPVKVIDAVLNYDRHNYLYMSAKDDLSGYHNFSSNFDGHKKNAKSIRKQFNKLKL
ncbi:MAG: endolytic transglycosylase MltG [Solitalea-like symbiont of Acarus siro]